MHKKEMSFKRAITKSGKEFLKSSPIILGTIMLVSLITTIIPKSFYLHLFGKNIILDPIIGSLVGSISAGNPITSYIFGGEFLSNGTSLLAVTAFLVSWVTVGIIQLPAEAAMLGKRFAFIRNLSSFILSIIVAILTVIILGAL